MKRILLPTDFSANASQAIHYACSYFDGTPTEFFLLNVQKAGEFVMDDLMGSKPGSSIHKAIAADNKEALSSLEAGLKERYRDQPFTFTSLFDYDAFADAVRQTVDQRQIDLIVMGTNGASGTKEALFGSNTLQVIRKVPCPVLAIPEHFGYNGLKQLMISVIEGAYPGEQEFAMLREFLGNHKPQIHILAINKEEMAPDERKDHEQKVQQAMGHFGLEFHYLDGIPIPMAIHAFAQLKAIDLHALHLEKEPLMKRFIYGSTTSTISYDSETPLLVLNQD